MSAAGWPPLFTQADLDAAVRDAVAQEQVRSLTDITRKNTELAMANTMRRHWENVADSRLRAAEDLGRVRDLATRPLPRGRRATRARLDQITRILKETQ